MLCLDLDVKASKIHGHTREKFGMVPGLIQQQHLAELCYLPGLASYRPRVQECSYWLQTRTNIQSHLVGTLALAPPLWQRCSPASGKSTKSDLSCTTTCSRPASFGTSGSLEEGKVMRWLLPNKPVWLSQTVFPERGSASLTCPCALRCLQEQPGERTEL